MPRHNQATPFLKLVAKAFHENKRNELRDICFIFPNRRSGVFFTKELMELSQGKPFIMPEITSISQFVCDITSSVEITKIEALLVLYKEYARLMGENAEDFDKFAYWGDTLLNDFNDVDKYLVEPQQVFCNVKDLKDLQTNYLTQEQLDTIERYFGKTNVHRFQNTEDFWANMQKGSSGVKKFLSLWEILHDLYKAFNEAVAKTGLSYSGKIYKNAVNVIRNMSTADFRHNCYVFVGFNVLSTSELKIFELLGQKGIADYYWDYNSPALTDRRNKASWFVGRNVDMFKSRLDLKEETITTFPEIHATGIPSNIGQAKHTRDIIDRLIADGSIHDPKNATDTAIVLPEENMLTPLLDSINSKITNVNITMGYPLRNSSIAILVAQIAKLHKQARKENGEFCYFHEDIREITSHPYIKLIAPDEVSCLISHITKYNLFYVSVTTINEIAPSLSYIFEPVLNTSDSHELIKYVKRIINFAEKYLLASQVISDNSIDMGFITAYVDKLNQLASIIGNYDILMNGNTFFYLVDRILSSATVALEGEPLNGLQIMGILETRCLDFDNLIIMSMNERIFPRKHYSKSFIPHNLRRGYGMATIEFQECMYSYYFYRMISRAKKIFLLFDSRTQAIGSGEPSRFVYQLQMLYPQSHIILTHAGFNVYAPDEISLSIPKNARIMKILQRYQTDGSNEYLSASAINHYINCPVAFYFEKVEKLSIDDDMTEFMDSSTLGTIIHAVLQQLYSKAGKKQNNGIYIDAAIIETILKHPDDIMKLINFTINKEYLNREDGCTEVLSGETYLIGSAIFLLIKRVLNYEKEQPFTLLQCEKAEKLHWKFPDGFSINFKQYIDRVDCIKDFDGRQVTRIIDYKTGGDKTTTKAISQMFNDKSSDRRKAMLQLMLYCNAYAILHNTGDTPIQPIIYTIKNIGNSGFSINSRQITDFHEINDEFMEQFEQIVREIFDPDIPFRQTRNERNCQYCKFIDFCRK